MPSPSKLLVQATFLFLIAQPGLSLRLPLRLLKLPNNESKAAKPLVVAKGNADQIGDLLLKTEKNASTARASDDAPQALHKVPSSGGGDVANRDIGTSARPNDEEQQTPNPVDDSQLGADVPQISTPANTTDAISTNGEASAEQAGGGSDSPQNSTEPISLEGRALSDYTGPMLDLIKSGPGVQSDLAALGLELIGSAVGDKVRNMASNAKEVVSGVAESVGNLSGKTVNAAGNVAATAIEAAGAGSASVVRTVGSVVDAVSDFIGLG